MSRLLLLAGFVLLLALALPAAEPGPAITHGPILGRLGAHEIGVWVRTARPGKAARDARGRLVFTFDPPVRWSVGDRMEFSLR